MDGIETRRAAALATEQRDTTEHTEDKTGDGGENKARRELRSRSRLGRYFGCCTLRQAAGRRRSRAIGRSRMRRCRTAWSFSSGAPPCRTAPPSSVPSLRRPQPPMRTWPGIVPAIFDRSAAAYLGIEMPAVATGDAGYPILSTSVSSGAGPVAKSADADESAGAFLRHHGATPAPNWFSFRFTVEDAARLSRYGGMRYGRT